MRRLFNTILVVSASARSAQASLACLRWNFTEPTVDVICTFEPDAPAFVDHPITSGIEGVISEADTVAQLSLTHNPVELSYDYIFLARVKGLEAANANIKEDPSGFGKVTIKFKGGIVNAAETGLGIMSYPSMADLTYCLVNGAVDEQNANLSFSAHGTLIIPESDVGGQIAKDCLTQDFQQSSNLQVFQDIADSGGRVSVSFSDIASLLVPVAIDAIIGEEVVGFGDAIETTFTLAIPGHEDASTRIFKIKDGGPEGVAEGFTEDEALAVQQELQSDPKWHADSCRVCDSSALAGGPTKRHLARLYQRGNWFSMCCPGGGRPKVVGDPEAPSLREQYNAQPATFSDRFSYRRLEESSLGPTPNFFQHESTASGEAMRKDLSQFNAALIDWSPEMIQLQDSAAFFAQWRDIFTSPSKATLRQKLRVNEGTYRSRTLLEDWSFLDDEELQPLQDFGSKSSAYALGRAKEILGPLPRGRAYRSSMEIFYIPPGEAFPIDAQTHIDSGLLSFGAADQPGLVIDTRPGLAPEAAKPYRPDPLPNTMLIFADDKITQFEDTIGDIKPTFHAVFDGDAISENGRVSVIWVVNSIRVLAGRPP